MPRMSRWRSRRVATSGTDRSLSVGRTRGQAEGLACGSNRSLAPPPLSGVASDLQAASITIERSLELRARLLRHERAPSPVPHGARAAGDPSRAQRPGAARDRAAPRAGAEWSCGTFELGLSKATLSHHFRVLREAGVVRTRPDGRKRLLSLRDDDLNARFPGLLEAVLSREERGRPPQPGRAPDAQPTPRSDARDGIRPGSPRG